ncbi:hypothetical protein FSP39_000635 [Pinctada imbricata]|uniref:Uncharacterized protein n=1 Tax=Pinctada imbricata TaxID=66713 RepID=A0AA89BY54_PINIB|nr:hypothetical protein FSP39_000635 [Pinctada imbricata]
MFTLFSHVSAGFIFLSVIIYGAYKDNMSWAWAFCILAFLMDNAAGVMTLRDFGTNVKLQRNAK